MNGFTYSANHGNIDIIIWLFENNFSYNENALSYAFNNEKCEVIK
jgi:hypothetical protein